MLLARKVQFCQRPSFDWRLSSLVTACLVIGLAAATAGIRPAAAQASDAARTAEDGEEAPPTSQVAEKKAHDEAIAGEERRAPSDAAGNPTKRSTARENLQSAEVDRLLAERDILKAQLEATRAQIEALTSQMDELKASAAEVRAKRLDGRVVETRRLLDLTRVNEDGSITSEIWSTDAKGQPQELLGKRRDKSPQESPWSVTTITGDDEIVKEFAAEDGTRVTYVFDAGTGRVIRREFSRGRDVPSKAPAARALKPGARFRASALRNAELVKAQERKNTDQDVQPGASESSNGGRAAGRSPADLDLVGLVTAYSDALAETDKAKAALNEVPESRAAFRSAERKQRFLKMFVEEAANTAKSNLEYSRKMASRGYVTADSVANAEFRLRILNDILNAENDAPAGQPATAE